jgi:hypothetical protein
VDSSHLCASDAHIRTLKDLAQALSDPIALATRTRRACSFIFLEHFMDILITNLGPIAQLFSATHPEQQNLLRRLLGTIPTPADAPNAPRVIARVGRAISAYRQTLAHLRQPHAELFRQVELLTQAIAPLCKKDITPATQLVGRQKEYPVWRFLLLADEAHQRLLIAAGAEIIYALLHLQLCSNRFFGGALRDLNKLSRPGAREPLDEEALATLHFGAGWVGHFMRVDRTLRKLMLQPTPPGSDLFEGAARAHQRLRDSIVQHAAFPQQKHRAGVSNHRHLPPSQLRAVLCAVRQRTAEGDCSAIDEALQILTGLPSDVVLQIPMRRRPPGNDWCAHLDLAEGVLLLNLDSIFPSRRRPPLTSLDIFEPASAEVRSPLPDFLHRALQIRLNTEPHARCVGDLLNWPSASGERSNLLPDQPTRILPSIARARASLAIDAIGTGVPRSIAAAMCWDFGLIPTARPYYLRLDHSVIHLHWCGYLEAVGWNISTAAQEYLQAFGAHCVLSKSGTRRVFEHFVHQVQALAPGRNCRLEKAIRHHNAYARYVGAVLSFCSGLRGRNVYDINAHTWQPGHVIALLNDKRHSRLDFERPVALSNFSRLILRDWFAHCAALKGRIVRATEASNWQSVIQQLAAIEHHQNVPLVFLVNDNHPCPIGHAEVWNSLPPALATPANAGRSFWASKLQECGCSSFLIDIFMRHAAHGLESESSSRSLPLDDALQELILVQDAVISEIGMPYVYGLRSAA